MYILEQIAAVSCSPDAYRLGGDRYKSNMRFNEGQATLNQNNKKVFSKEFITHIKGSGSIVYILKRYEKDH